MLLKHRFHLMPAVFQRPDAIVLAHENFRCEMTEAVRFWVFFHVFANKLNILKTLTAGDLSYSCIDLKRRIADPGSYHRLTKKILKNPY